jgi:hypothetical protein
VVSSEAEPELTAAQRCKRARVGDSVLMLDEAGSQLVLLSPVAGVVLEGIEAGLNQDAMAASIAARFGLKEEVVLGEVDHLLAVLRPGSPPVATAGPRTADPASGEAATLDELLEIAGRLVRIRCVGSPADLRLLDKLRHRRVEAGQADVTLAIVGTERRRGLALLREGMPPVHAATRRELAGHLYQALIEAAHPDRQFLVFLHAGAVVSKGRSVLLAGASGSGKSTLTARLVVAGAAYLSDELVGVTADELALCPLPTALSLKPAGWPAASALLTTALAGRDLPQTRRGVRHLDPATLGNVAAQGPAASAIVFPHFQTGAAGLARRLSPEQCLQRLLEDGLGIGAPLLPCLPQRLVAWLDRLPAWELTYGDGAWARRWVEELLDAGP